MRVFYLFNIKDEFASLYKKNESNLFNIFRYIYNLNKEDIEYANTLFRQLTNNIDKSDIDKYLFIKLHKEIPYSKRGDTHIINNLYRNEISKLIAKNNYIKIITEIDSSSFFNIISKLNMNLFACDFSNIDFFFLDRIKHLV